MAQCTFKPKLNESNSHYARRRPKESIEEISQRLSQVESREQYERRIERRRRQLEEQKGATFKPRTSKRRSASARRSRGGTDSDSDSNRGSIWDRLNTDRETLEKRNKRLREERERRELAKCTFQPDISRKKTPRRKAGTASSPSSVDQKREADGSGASRANAKSGRTPRALGDVPVWERLSGVNMSALKVQRDEMKKRREMAECTFQPKLVKPASQAKMLNGDEGNDSTPRKPIWERLYEGKKDMQKIEQLAAERELASCTFVPHISEGSEHIVSPQWRKDQTPIWKRLYDDALEEQKRETENERVRKALEMHGCTFSPNIRIGDEEAAP